MSDRLIINLREEAEYIYTLIYKDLDYAKGYENGFYKDIEGYAVQTLSVMEIMKYLYYGVRDREGEILIWANSDTRDRVKYLTNETQYAKPLPSELEIVAISVIDKVIIQEVIPYVNEHGCEYSILLYSFVSDSLNIGIGTDIRIIEWEEACRGGKIKPKWMPESALFKTTKYLDLNTTDKSVSLNCDLVSDNPVEVNEAILTNHFSH